MLQRAQTSREQMARNDLATNKTKSRPCKTAPPAPSGNLREARAAEYLQMARDRNKKKRDAIPKSDAEGMIAVCVVHGLPCCKKCKKASKARKDQNHNLVAFEVENTSLDIGGTSHGSTQKLGRPTTGSSSSRATPRRAPLSDLELGLQTRLFRHKKAAIEAACAKFDRHGDGFLTCDEFGELLGSLMLHPGAADFSQLWREYDPQGLGRISHASWLTRFVSSVSLPDGCNPPCVIARGGGGRTSRFCDISGAENIQPETQRSSGSRMSMQSSNTRSVSARPRSSASHFSIDCASASLNVR